ncbi:MAG: hypothetical protein HOE53_02985 [Candidatus Magasanikbacteria bacterium]|nr:hypothetical protein [Candidatus Magasanikbacteria bacterium]
MENMVPEVWAARNIEEERSEERIGSVLTCEGELVKAFSAEIKLASAQEGNVGDFLTYIYTQALREVELDAAQFPLNGEQIEALTGAYRVFVAQNAAEALGPLDAASIDGAAQAAATALRDHLLQEARPQAPPPNRFSQ